MPNRPMKDAFLLLVVCTYAGVKPHQIINADLVFSTKEKFDELWGLHRIDSHEQLLPIRVPADFTEWDFVPENY